MKTADTTGIRITRGRAALSVASAFLLFLSAAGCGGGGKATTAEATKPRVEPLKIGLLLDNLHERWQRDRDLIKEVVEDMGGQLLVEVAEGDQAKQDQQADKLLAAGVKSIILVAHDTNHAASLVEKAKAKNVVVIGYDRLVRDADLDLFLGFDTVKVGELQARFLLDRAPRGNYVLVGGSETDGNAKDLRKGQMNVLGPAVKAGAIKIVGEGWAENWRADAAAKIVEKALAKSKQLAAVVASNDVTAGGAIGVLEQQGLASKVLVSGQDAELDAAKRIVAGTQTMTVYKSLRTITRLAARSAMLMARGEKVDTSATVANGKKDVPAMLFDPIAVDKDNIDGILIGDGFLKRSDVYGSE